jgi:exopolyphosphatase / guanosine-5'-triphosphate,3'-diphosphate pyrophosphatase
MTLGAIDIGSNAARLLVTETSLYKDDKVDYNKINLLRVPLRLGFDVFAQGTISAQKQDALIHTMHAFKHLMAAHNVSNYKIAATSALRDAANAADVIQKVFDTTGMKISVISGDEEAALLYESHAAEEIINSNHHLYIDVGGGSTELTLFYKNQVLFKHSYNIGTIRFLTNTIDDAEWTALKTQCKAIGKQYKSVDAIGTGGNINKVHNLSKIKEGKPLSYEQLKQWHETLEPLSKPDRMHNYGLKDDRADVIVPALLIYSCVMKWTGSRHIYVPKIGVADALIKVLYKELGY